MNSKDESDSYLVKSYLVPAAIFLGVLLALSIFSWIVLTSYNARIAILMINTVLSALVVFVYLWLVFEQNRQRGEISRQADLQEKLAANQSDQNEILKQQQELLELDYRPIILVEDFDIQGAELKLDLMNLGRGLAENIAVRPRIRINDDLPDDKLRHDHSAEAEHILYSPDEIFFRELSDGTEYVPKVKTATRNNSGSVMSMEMQGGILSPDEGEVEFSTPVKFGKIKKGQSGAVDLLPSRIFDILDKNGIEEISIDIDLLYCNEAGDISITPIIGKSGKLTSDMELEDIENLTYSSTGTRHEIKDTINKIGTYPPPDFS